MSKEISIVVLPFQNFSKDAENEYFCDGMTEEIINALAKISQLKVISRTSSFYYKDRQTSIKEIGEALKVSFILEGSVRIGGNTLRISTQLIKVEEDEQFWSETWDRKMENLFEIQDEVSLLISDKLREHVGHLDISDQLVEPQTQNLTAYQHYLKGKYLFNKWNPEDTNLAIQEFAQVVELDKNLIDGYLGLADAYSFLAVAGFAPREESWAKAIQAMETAKKIDNNHAGLNYMLANQAFFTEANYKNAFGFALKSLGRTPTFSESRRFLLFLYTLNGEFQKAKEHLFYVKSIDPLNPETLFFEAYYYYRNGEYQPASDILNKLLKDNDKNVPAWLILIYIHIKKRETELARTQIESLPQELFTPDERLGLLCLINITDGKTHSSLLTELIEQAQNTQAHHAHSYLFIAYAMLHQFEEAFKVLDYLFEHQSSILLLGFSEPLAANIQESERFQEYHQRIYPKIESRVINKASKTRNQDDSLIQKQLKVLHEFIETEQPYLNPSLSLRLLADQIDIHPNQLSWLINEHLGKNFNEFINQLRVEHFKKIALDPSNSHISLIGLAFESGFNSKTVFNTTFKKETGMTPKQYQKSHSQEK